MGHRPRIALVIDTATTWGAGLIQGIAEYAHAHADWQLLLGPRGKYDRTILPLDWNGDGVIARITHQPLADQIVALGLPAVDVSWYRFGEGRIPRCTCDERAIAKLGAEYFIGLGFRQFAYCGSSIRPNYIDRLGEAFVDVLRKRGFNCGTYFPRCDPVGIMPPAGEIDHLSAWLRELPKPVALLAFDSLQARQITEACEAGEIGVPHEVAVLGGEYDYLSCTISKPHLSSIDHSPCQVGHTAAELLASLMRGESPPTEPIFVPVTRVIPGQSTDVIAIEDELISAAVKFIKDRCHERIQVSDVLSAVPLSRRAMEKAFRNYLGRSPAEEIRRARVDRAVQLLCDTSWPMTRIASASGFERPELLTRAFRRELGTTPSDFRRQHVRGRTTTSAFGQTISS